MFERIITELVRLVYGHYAHPYTLYLTAPMGLGMPLSVRPIKYVGNFKGAVEMARKAVKTGRALRVVVVTQGGRTVHEAF